MAVIAILAPGVMGAGLAARLYASGSGSILTNLEGRSAATRERAAQAHMEHASYVDIVQRATHIYSVVPPGEASAVAQTILDAYKESGTTHKLIFADCNAINVQSVKHMAALFVDSGITFLDGSIIGLPPSANFNPAIYLSGHADDGAALESFVTAGVGLNIVPLRGDGAGIGDASAVKMAHSGVVKGLLGLFSTSILAANASSPSTAGGLLHALQHTQPALVQFAAKLLPQALPKAYRFVAEMDEVGGFVGGNGAQTFEGLSATFSRIADADARTPPGLEIELLLKFAEEAQKIQSN
ncbi:NAD-binding phosphogluconate dehydrogenase-like protein [Mycena chlorophos]|uniref:NAD-binding phosphogluconate dehydrogenase-like protein n=1 Tax=Mycena chlorophos TaxID=658473 RepID=A0A8H6TLF3_MYCCL|nr:NAD-binding phosphogluconate dehydrogenase-like protein [Mycena chlorophos]